MDTLLFVFYKHSRMILCNRNSGDIFSLLEENFETIFQLLNTCFKHGVL